MKSNVPDRMMAPTQPLLTRDGIRSLALDIGFTEGGLVALPHAHEERDANRFSDWLDAGRAGTMEFLKRTDDTGQAVRARASIPFPWARTAIVCMTSYHSAQPRSTDAADAGAGWIARYAWSSRVESSRAHPKGIRRPSDYHKIVLKRLRALERRLQAQYGPCEARAYVDTGPLVERALATAAGLGWTAKNTCLIHPKHGSYTFLGVIVTSLEVEPEPATLKVPDHCGTCRRCLDACPTDALFAPYQMDATRCISYLTIEHRGPIAPELMQGMGRQVFGCDICQDVCPWNRKAPIGVDRELEARADLVNPALDWLASLSEQKFEERFNGSPIHRARFAGLQRNVAIAIGNSGQRRYADWLRAWADAADEGLRSAARWALSRLAD